MKFAFLNLQGAPRGNFQLSSLIQAGFVPSVIVEEESKTAQNWRLEHLEDLALPSTHPILRPLETIVQGHKIDVFTVSSHNNKACEKILQNADVDLIILGETRIIRPNIIRQAKTGVINTHPGYIPLVRGNDPVVWAAKYNLPQGCSVHLVNEGVDSGPIILRRQMFMDPDETFSSLMVRIDQLCGEVLVAGLKRFLTPGFSPQPQETDGRPAFKAASPAVKRSVIRHLEMNRHLPSDANISTGPEFSGIGIS